LRILVVTAMYPSKERPAYGTFVKEQVESLRSAGIEVDVLCINGNDGMKGYLVAVQEMRNLMKATPYDLVHAHYGLSGATARMQVHSPLVVTFHGSDLLGGVGSQFQYTFEGRVKVLISKFVGLVAAKCIVVADLLKSKLRSQSVVTIPMGVDLSLFRPINPREAREKLGLTQDRQRVLFAANPSNRLKRFDIAEAAVGLLREIKPNIELLPIYDVAHEKVPLYMNACDVLVLTSMHEASPCVIKEALACNLRIVSVDVGDVARRINGVSGCYLCERTPEDVATKLHQALDGCSSTNGRDKIQHLSLQNIAQEVIAVYEDLIGRA
jgi:glycosyltransferase involved in cell wall biosynthesis